jgi:hypothetical protein
VRVDMCRCCVDGDACACVLQLISGVSIMAYWLSTFLWDIVNYLLPFVMSIILVAVFGIHELIDGERGLATVLLFFFYGTSVAVGASLPGCMWLLWTPTGGVLSLLLGDDRGGVAPVCVVAVAGVHVLPHVPVQEPLHGPDGGTAHQPLLHDPIDCRVCDGVDHEHVQGKPGHGVLLQV